MLLSINAMKHTFLMTIAAVFFLLPVLVSAQDYIGDAQCNERDTVVQCRTKINNWCFANTIPAERIQCNTVMNAQLDTEGLTNIDPEREYSTVCSTGQTTQACNAQIVNWCANNRLPAERPACNQELQNHFGITPSTPPPPTTGAQQTEGGSNQQELGDIYNLNLFDITIDNPLQTESGEIRTVEGLITIILEMLIIIMTPLAALAIMFAGFTYVTARGEPGKIKQAHTAITMAVIGTILILGAITLSSIIEGTIGQFRVSAP